MTTNDGFGGGPSTVVALFTYGDVILQTHNCIMRDAVFAGRESAKVEAQAATLAAACEAAGEDGRKSIMEAVKPLRHWPVVVIHPAQDALIDRSRAVCVKRFLEDGTAEVLVMVDHDQDWRGAETDAEGHITFEGDLCHLARKCAETKGIVGAAVSKKTRGEGVACLWKEESYGEHQLGSDGMLPVHYVGAAFTAYHRDCLQAVVDSMKEVPPGFAPIFMPMVVPHPVQPDKELHLSEDWAFCHRANELGFSSHVSMKPLINHWGMYPYGVVRDAMADPTPRKKISLIHATRGRPLQAMQAKCDWLSKVSGRHDIEYIRSTDVDDETVPLDGDMGVTGESRGCVDAYNRGAAAASGEILVQMHDDVEPPQDWDAIIAARMDTTKAQVLHVSDGTKANPDKPWLVTIMIATRPWIEKLGGLFHPEYVSVFCDDDASQKAMKDDCIVPAKDVTFLHRWEGAARDETQRRSYSPENFAHGQRVFTARKAAGFPDAFKG